MSENRISFEIKVNHKPSGSESVIKLGNYSYCSVDQIGLGYSSKVFQGRNDLTGEAVAIKVIDTSKQDDLSQQFLNQEITILQMIRQSHPSHLLMLYQTIRSNQHLCIITELCEGKDVAKLLRKKKKLTEVQAQSIMKQLMISYREMYDLGIVHRDLKLANAFIKSGRIKLADFGFATNVNKCRQCLNYNVGSPYYMAPETLKLNKYSFKSDIWSLGVMAYELVYGKLPWKDKNQSTLYDKIMGCNIQTLFDADTSISNNYKFFIKTCLEAKLEKRASPDFVINYQWPMAEPFVEGVVDGSGSRPNSSMKNIFSPLLRPYATHKEIGETKYQHSRQQSFAVQQQIRQRQKSPNLKTKMVSFLDIAYQSSAKVLAQANVNSANRIKNASLNQSSLKKPVEYTQIHSNQQNNACAIKTSKQGRSSQVERSIMNKLHYCRFLSNLFDVLEQTNILPEGYLLRHEILTKLNQILSQLSQLEQYPQPLQNLRTDFLNYRTTLRWKQLLSIINAFTICFRQKHNRQQINLAVEGEVLVKSIAYLKSDMNHNVGLVEQLLYYYQLRELQKGTWQHFSVNAKMDLIICRKPYNQRDYNQEIRDRLVNRINIIGI